MNFLGEPKYEPIDLFFCLALFLHWRGWICLDQRAFLAGWVDDDELVQWRIDWACDQDTEEGRGAVANAEANRNH